MSGRAFPPVPGGYPFPQLELEVLDFWRRERIFERTLEATAKGEPFVFYEGPPTANNAPHVGHVLTRVVKDLFPRFQTMRGRHVARKAGWDTHGLAVEIEVEKRLGISGKKAIEQLVPGDPTASIETFNRACLESVMTYERAWRAMSERVGYWMNYDDAYYTYANGYIESVWWAIRTLYDRGLLFEGHKSQPYCARCGTTLSSHEVAQNYKDTDDPSIWVLFPVRPGQTIRAADGGSFVTPEALSLVAWTTTPWTVPGHSGLVVHPDFVYRVVARPDHPGRFVIFADAIQIRIPAEIVRDGKLVAIDLRDEPVVARLSGSDLVGLRYDRPYRVLPWDSRAESDVFQPLPTDENGWVVVPADYVTLTDGTGIVHTAPAFGADDYATGQKFGLPLLQTIDAAGKVVARSGIEPFAGLWFKDADREVLRDLKERGLLLHSERYRHSYPFCWRCDTPLLQYATKSWFVKTTAIRDRLVARNQEIAWHPATIGTGRFGNWLEGVVDWALSRNRYWGTPLPIWKCDGCPQTFVAGSFEDLFATAGREAPADLYDRSQFDPHRPAIDAITWPCYACRGGTFRRVPDVADAWFDSGAMPFAEHHFMGDPLPEFQPESKMGPRRGFPADFISEAIDQTRGWFYTLHVLAAALFDSYAFADCIVLGHINDEQGRKMSKRLGNVIDPMKVIEETGADAMRWYFFVNDPEQTSRFSTRLVREAAQSFLLPLWNAVSFFTIYANLDDWHPGDAPPIPFDNRPDLDRWILWRLNEEIEKVTLALESYDIVDAARRLQELVDDLTNWYIRRSRSRFWGDRNKEAQVGGKEAACQTLFEVLTKIARLAAPFVPFFAEKMHEVLVRSQSNEPRASIHLENWPASESLGGEELPLLMQGMNLVLRATKLGRAARNTHGLKNRQPLGGATLIAADPKLRQAIHPYLEPLKEELNVKEVRWAERRGEFVRHEVRPNFPVLGKKLGKRMKAVQAALSSADGDALAEALERGGRISIDVEGDAVMLESGDLEVRLIEKEGMATAGDRELLVALDTHLTPELVAEGRAREVVNRIQNARKDAGLDYSDRIRIRYAAAPDLEAAIAAHRAWIGGETLTVDWIGAAATDAALTAADIDGLAFAFAIDRAS